MLKIKLLKENLNNQNEFNREVFINTLNNKSQSWSDSTKFDRENTFIAIKSLNDRQKLELRIQGFKNERVSNNLMYSARVVLNEEGQHPKDIVRKMFPSINKMLNFLNKIDLYIQQGIEFYANKPAQKTDPALYE